MQPAVAGRAQTPTAPAGMFHSHDTSPTDAQANGIKVEANLSEPTRSLHMSGNAAAENGNSRSMPRTQAAAPSSKEVPWAGFELTNDVQTLLDHNKLLLNEIEANHADKGPEALARNELLIQELNGNIDKVVKLYQDMDASFEEYNAANAAVAAVAATTTSGGAAADAIQNTKSMPGDEFTS